MFLFILFICFFSPAQDFQTYKKIEIIESKTSDIQNPESLGLIASRPTQLFSEDSFLEISNLNFAGGTNHTRYLQIRGMGETSVYENTPAHSLNVLLDHIDLTGLIASWPAMNLSKMQIAKTAQSVSQGGLSSAGSVTSELTSPGAINQLQATSASQGAYSVGVNFDLSKKNRFFAFMNQDQGFYKNIYTNKSGDQRDEYYVSLKNYWLNSSDWRLSSSHIALQSLSGYDVWSLNQPQKDDDFETLSDHQGQDNLQLHGHSMTVERKLLPDVSMISISSLTRAQSLYSYDADWGNNKYWQQVAGQNYDYFDEFKRDRTTGYEKLFLKTSMTETGMHVYVLNESSDIKNFKNSLLKNENQSTYQTLNTAVFTHNKLSLSQSNTLHLGGRYEEQRIKYQDSFIPTVQDKQKFLAWEAKLEHQLNLNTISRFLISQGFKSSGVNIEFSAPERFYKPESVTTYEFGFFKKDADSKQALTLFFTDQRDKQVKVSHQDDPTDPSSFSYSTSNAAHATTYGLEIESQKNFDSWLIETQIGLMKSEFKNYFFENKDLSGKELAHAPSWNYSLGLTKKWSERFSNFMSLTGKSDFAFSNNHDARSENSHLVNFGLNYQKNAWRFTAWIKNIFDSRYATRGFYFANEPPDWQNKLYVQNGPPRHLGLSLSYLF